jgi:uncharacterized protein (TIGR03084 family)
MGLVGAGTVGGMQGDRPGVAVAIDLIAEQAHLDTVVDSITAGEWVTPTPSPGWTVADQIAHLTYFDRAAATAISDPDRFRAERDELIARVEAAGSFDDATLAEFKEMTPRALLAAWRYHRVALADAVASVAPDSRVDWYGPSMSLRSFLTARLMEAWAHGRDVTDALGATPSVTDRLRHIAQLGVITRAWSYRNRGLEVPDGQVAVTLTAPSGATWSWNDDASGSGAAGSISGPAEDFCLVVTQRRHIDDTALVTQGPLAREWMLYAQAFAGGATIVRRADAS